MLSHHRYIVVKSSIDVGKTTLVKKLTQTFPTGLVLEKVDTFSIIYQFYQNPVRYNLSTQQPFFLQRARQIQNFRQIDLFQNAHIADLLIHKDLLFAELTLNTDELELYQRIYQKLTIYSPRSDLIIYLQAPVKILQFRIAALNRFYEQAITLDYLPKLSNAYTQFFHNYDKKYYSP